jgi:hypothetical protein
VRLQGSLACASAFHNRYRRRGRKEGRNLAIHSLDHDEARDSRIAEIYVPIKRACTSLEQKRGDEIAASRLDDGQQAPILVRADGALCPG